MNMRGLPAIQYATGGDVAAAYNRILGREPDTQGFNWWMSNLAREAGYDRLADVPVDVVFNYIGAGAGIDPELINTAAQQYIQQGPTAADALATARATGASTDNPFIQNMLQQATGTAEWNPPVTEQQQPVIEEAVSPIESLYQEIFKRSADPGGLEYYTKRFGETVEPAEREQFIRNAVGTGELTQEQADALLGTTTGAPTTAPTAAKPEDMVNRLLYQPILGRAGDPGGLEFYQREFLGKGDTMISPQERARFIQGALESGELSQRAADAYLGTIPGVPSLLPAGAAAIGRVDPNFLRTAAPAIATNPITGQPQLQGPTSLIKGTAPVAEMAEGGDVETAGGRALTPAEIGSRFDIESYKDPEGRLISGYSRPIRDEFGTILGYEDRPYESDVVFNPILARREEEERQRMRTMAEGGLASAAQNLAARGRYGDSTLVHMAPEELSGLRALARAQGNDLTINPRTGLPEAFSLKKLFKAASFILPFVPIPGLFGMSSLLTRSILSGVAAGASAKGKFDFKQALGGGLKAYALGSLGEKMSGATTPGGTPTAPTVTAPEAASVNVMGDVTGVPGEIPSPSELAQFQSPAPLQAPISRVDAGFANVGAPGTIVQPGQAPITSSVEVSPGNLPMGTESVPGRMSSVITPEGQGFGQPLTKGTEIAMAGLGGLSIEEGAKEQRNYEMQAAAARREEDERKRRFEELFRRTLGNVPTAKEGGLMKLAKGGMTYMEGGGATGPAGEPRVIRGTGDGMSDSVPATIEGVQEARLANDEFVIPADVVADIGNGSSDAGAKKLYGMMDRIRKARHGTTKQPPEINAERLMPA